MAEDEMVGWHHQLNGHEFGSTHGIFQARVLEWVAIAFSGLMMRRPIAPGRRSAAPTVWKLTRSFPIQACKDPPAA